MSRPRIHTAVLLVAGALLGGVTGVTLVHASCGPQGAPTKRSTPTAERGPELIVPRAAGEITIDGELEDPGWSGPLARAGAFVDREKPAHPYSDARFVYRDGQLFVVLYAADEDIRIGDAGHDDPLYMSDAFELVFRTPRGELLIDVSPGGVVTDARRTADGGTDFRWESHARVSVDRDGTVNDRSDQDEEWVVEMAIPLDALGLTGKSGERVGFTVRRCDHVPNAGRVCGTWGAAPGEGTLVLGGDGALTPRMP